MSGCACGGVLMCVDVCGRECGYVLMCGCGCVWMCVGGCGGV